MNSVQLHGRLTKDIELKTNTNGTEYCNFDIAINRYMGKDKEEQTDFIPCKAYGKTAVFLNTFFGKGKEIVANGTLHHDKYEKDGEKQNYIHVLVSNAEFCGPKQEQNKSTQPGNQSVSTPPSPAEQVDFKPMESADPYDLPF